MKIQTNTGELIDFVPIEKDGKVIGYKICKDGKDLERIDYLTDDQIPLAQWRKIISKVVRKYSK